VLICDDALDEEAAAEFRRLGVEVVLV
jgi:hypothetical protein